MSIYFTDGEIRYMQGHPEVLRAVADYHDLQICQGEPMGFTCAINKERQAELKAEADRIEAAY